MANIRDRESLLDWLTDQPKEIAVIIAARAALRVLPLAISDKDLDLKAPGGAILLPCFRASAAAWAAGTWPAQAAGLEAAADAAANAAALSAADFAGSAALSAALSATDSAFSALSAADFADLSAARYTALFQQINHDAEVLERGGDSHALGFAPLWRGDSPREIQESWEKFQKALPNSRYQNWNVWTDWYRDRLSGADGSRPIIEKLEIARVLIADEEWEKGPAHVNAMIQALEDAHRGVFEEGEVAESPPDLDDGIDLPDAVFEPGDEVDPPAVPSQRPAVIEVEPGEDGRLRRKPSAPPPVDDAARDRRLRDAWAAHETALSALEALNPGRNEPGLTSAIAAYRDAMGTSYDDLNVIALGAHGERLIGYTARIDDLLVGAGAAELAALVALHGLFVRQFEAWREYVGDSRPDPTPEVVAAAAALSRETRNFPNLFARDLINVAVDLGEAATPPLTADPDDRLPRAVAFGVVDSDINILSGLSTQVPRYLRDAGSRARIGSLDGVENAARRATEAALFFGLGSIGTLITGLPGELSYLTGIIALLKSGGASSQSPEPKAPEASPREIDDDDDPDDRVY